MHRAAEPNGLMRAFSSLICFERNFIIVYVASCFQQLIQTCNEVADDFFLAEAFLSIKVLTHLACCFSSRNIFALLSGCAETVML